MANKSKDLRNVASSLASVAERYPTQNTRAASEPEGQGASPPAEPIVQFSFGLRKSLRKELARLAAEEDMTMRAFILDALRDKGLSVTEEDLLDLRRHDGRTSL